MAKIVYQVVLLSKPIRCTICRYLRRFARAQAGLIGFSCSAGSSPLQRLTKPRFGFRADFVVHRSGRR